MDAVLELMQQEVAATRLVDLFASATRTRNSMSGGCVKAFEGLDKNRTAKKELFKYLLEDAEQH